MLLTSHFSLAELTASQTAVRAGLDNTPPDELLPTLRRLAEFLEEVRAVLMAPVIVTSGYRSPKVNKLVGGAQNSAHTKGLAADFIAPKAGSPAAVCAALVRARLPFDQCILEGGAWCHVSIPKIGLEPRRQALTAVFTRGTNGRMVTAYREGIVA